MLHIQIIPFLKFYVHMIEAGQFYLKTTTTPQIVILLTNKNIKRRFY